MEMYFLLLQKKWLHSESFQILQMDDVYQKHLHQSDKKNICLHGDLMEEIYMEQTLGFVAQEELGLICTLQNHCRVDFSDSTLS